MNAKMPEVPPRTRETLYEFFHRNDIAKMEAEIEAAHDEMRNTLALLAWVVERAATPGSMEDRAARPAFLLIEECGYEALQWLVTRDAMIRELVRHELADEIEANGNAGGPRAMLVAHLLRSARPGRRGPHGDNVARNILILSAFEQVQQWPCFLEGVRERSASRSFDPRGEDLAAFAPPLVTEAAFSVALADELTRSLYRLPEAFVPTPDAIRSALRKGWPRSWSLGHKIFAVERE